MTLRVLTWNIRNGGGDRLDAVLAVLERERPDLLALQELRGFERRMPAFAAALGMTPHLARSHFGQPVAVLVRPPLRITGTDAVTWRLHHAAAAVTVATEAGPLTVVSTHLNPFSPYRRMREAVWLAHRYRPATRHVLLAGDLNSLDPATDHTAALAGLDSLHRRRHLRRDGSADTRAITAFERAGLRDLWRAGGDGDGRTVPTSIGGHEFGRMRLDYVLATAGLTGSVRVVREDTAYASDHYPLLATVAIRTGR